MIFTAAVSAQVISQNTQELLVLVVSLSMAATPVLQLARDWMTRGFVPEDFIKLERDANRAGLSAPFMSETGERARDLWRQAFDLLMQLESLERAVEGAAQDLARDQDAATLMTLKGERDQLRRLLNSDWAHPEEVESALPH